MKHKHNLPLVRPPTFHAPPRARGKIYLSTYLVSPLHSRMPACCHSEQVCRVTEVAVAALEVLESCRGWLFLWPVVVDDGRIGRSSRCVPETAATAQAVCLHSHSLSSPHNRDLFARVAAVASSRVVFTHSLLARTRMRCTDQCWIGKGDVIHSFIQSIIQLV